MARVLITGKANYTGSRSAKALAVAPRAYLMIAPMPPAL
jgi:hypothetical protein